MSLGTRVRLVALLLALPGLGAAYAAVVALGTAPDSPLVRWSIRGLYAFAFALPVALPMAAAWIRRRTGEETERAVREELAAAAPSGDGEARPAGDPWISIIRSSPLPLAILDRDLRYLAHSDRWITAYRLAEPSLVGRHHYDVFPAVSGRWRVIHQQCLAGETKHSAGERFPRADGRTDWIRWTVEPWRDADGEIGGLVMLTEVITAQREAELALAARVAELETVCRQLDAAADVAGLGYWTWLPETGDFEASDRLRRLLALPADAPVTLERLIEKVQPDEQVTLRARIRRAVERADPFSHQARVMVEGSPRLMRFAGRVECIDGEVSKVVGVIVDATPEG